MKPSLAGRLFRRLAGSRGSIVAPLSRGWQQERRIIADTRSRAELLLSDPAALQLMTYARAARSRAGAFAEAGVFKGGSARLICEEKGEAPLHLFDVFEALQGDASTDGNEIGQHFGRIHGRLAEVRNLLSDYPNVYFHRGVFPETTAGLEDVRFSFVHIDLDLPAPTVAALEYFHPRMVPGGIIVADDYCDRYVKPCIDDWLAGRGDTIIEMPWQQLIVVRQPARLSC